jgi:hypothetical protein
MGGALQEPRIWEHRVTSKGRAAEGDTFDWSSLRDASVDELAQSQAWKVVEFGSGWSVASGFVARWPWRVWRVAVDVAAPTVAVATTLGDQSIEELPSWNREFVEGEWLVAPRSGAPSWVAQVRVRYATPWPLSDREYRYAFRRSVEPDGSVLLQYESLPLVGRPSLGCTEARLHGTVHRLVPTEGGTRIEHLLSGDLGGAFPLWMQSWVLRGGLAAAQARDARALHRMFT